MIKRKSIPLGVKLHAALLALGYTDDEIVNGGIEWDHCPALALRFIDPETGEITPAQNDPRYIRPLSKAAHRIKTFGAGATTRGSDVGEAAKTKRLERAREAEQEEARRRLLARDPVDAPADRRKARWPKRPFPARAK